MAYTVVPRTWNIWTFEEEGVRSFLVLGREKALVIDTGYGEVDYLSLIRSRITTLPLLLVNTHSDGDHTGGNAQFEGLPRYAHPDEFSTLPGGGYLPAEDGFIFDLGGVRLEVVHLPGHTPGSIALLDRAQGILFSGDMAGEGTIWMFGPGRDLETFIRSQDRLAALSDVRQVYCCHGPLPVDPRGLFGDLKALARAALDGTSTWEPEHLSFGDMGFDVKRHRAGRVSLFTF